MNPLSMKIETLKEYLKKSKGAASLSDAAKRFRIEYFLKKLKSEMYTVIGKLSCTAYITTEPVPFKKRFEGKVKILDAGVKWAENVFDCCWMNIKGTLPANAENDPDVVFLIDMSGEGLVYDVEGNPKQGITCYASKYDYSLGLPVKKVVINNGLSTGRDVEFYIDCGANDLFGKMKNGSKIKELSIARRNNNIRGLYYDLQALISVYDFNKDESFAREFFEAVNSACEGNIDEAGAAVLREKMKPYLSMKNAEGAFEYSAIGHAHLDLAWLWPIRETKRKGARTFTNQFMNIDRYDGYIFGASQAQLYQWTRDNYPEIFEKIKEYYKNGRWDLQGATWVEMDSNLSGGESLIRQFLYGKKYFMEEFSEEMKILWLPDSFGYSACLPQLMQLADVPYFLTQKMSWNTVNKFPYHTFKWAGLDGTEVLAHLLPEDTYNSPLTGARLKAGEKNYRERKISDISMSLFGIGDGGGGPGFEHLERAVRYKDLKGIPKVKMEKSLDFFKKLDDENKDYPHYKGELYLEKHQGTYTTQSKNKMYNRKCEFAIRNYEMLAVLALDKDIELPITLEALEKLWKEILLYQFHDILPGSSINRVYTESVERYKIIFDKITSATEALAKKLTHGFSVINLNSFSYDGLIRDGSKWYKMNVPPFSTITVKKNSEVTEFYAKADKNTLENDCVRVTFDDGVISSVFDKKLQREIVAKGKKFNVFTLYKDAGDCWDIRPTKYQFSGNIARSQFIGLSTDGATAFAKVRYCAKDCIIDQVISITDGSPAIKFVTDICQNTSASMLRVALPLSIKTDVCNFNIQYGHIGRATTEKDSFDTAQFEVSGQKFVDMSEDEYGVSVITDSKYGYRCKKGTVDINLIRSPLMGPGKNVDFGMNHVEYEVFPHEGGLSSKTYAEAYLFNNPLFFISGNGFYEDLSFLSTDNENLIVDAVKVPEDGNGVIVRIYNCSAERQTGKVTAMGYFPSEIVGIMEKKRGDTDGTLDLRGFELVNIRFIKE